MSINSETGHAPNRAYFDQNGELHLNGSAMHMDESGSLVSSTTETHPAATVVFSSVVAVTAAGSTQGTAAALTGATSVVSGADGTKGVILPTPVVGQEVTVINTAGASALKVYADNGGTGGTINGGSANAAATLAAAKGATYICTAVSPSAWWSASN